MSAKHEFANQLRRGGFHLALMPIVSAETGQVVRHEALLRSANPHQDIEKFVKICHARGWHAPLDRVVLKASLAALAADRSLRLAVNISPELFRARHAEQLMEAHIAARPQLLSRLTLEVAETAQLPWRGIARLARLLFPYGTRIVLDDLDKLPPDEAGLAIVGRLDGIKLGGRDPQRISASLLSYARTAIQLGQSVTVEGIETAAQMAAWTDRLGFAPTCWQGHYFSPPPYATAPLFGIEATAMDKARRSGIQLTSPAIIPFP